MSEGEGERVRVTRISDILGCAKWAAAYCNLKPSPAFEMRHENRDECNVNALEMKTHCWHR